MDSPGLEPGAFCMQSRRDTATPRTRAQPMETKLLIAKDIAYLQHNKHVVRTKSQVSLAERSKAPDSSSGGAIRVGSNPTADSFLLFSVISS